MMTPILEDLACISCVSFSREKMLVGFTKPKLIEEYIPSAMKSPGGGRAERKRQFITS